MKDKMGQIIHYRYDKSLICLTLTCTEVHPHQQDKQEDRRHKEDQQPGTPLSVHHHFPPLPRRTEGLVARPTVATHRWGQPAEPVECFLQAWMVALCDGIVHLPIPIYRSPQCHKKHICRAHFGSTYTKIGTIQRRLAWPLHKDDMQIRETFHIFAPWPSIIRGPFPAPHSFTVLKK